MTDTACQVPLVDSPRARCRCDEGEFLRVNYFNYSERAFRCAQYKSPASAATAAVCLPDF